MPQIAYSDKPLDPEANCVIDALGGTGAVAQLCRVNIQAVSQWRRNGLPDARKQYLELLRPDVFRKVRRAAKATA